MIADGLGIHLGGNFFLERFTLARYPPLFPPMSPIRQRAEDTALLLLGCVDGEIDR